MYKILNARQLDCIKDIPGEVIQVIMEAVTILDAEYGSDRNENDGYGGFAVFLQTEEELEMLKQQLASIHIDLDRDVPEYVETIVCHDGRVFTATLILCGSDFGVLLVLPLEITPENLMQYLAD